MSLAIVKSLIVTAGMVLSFGAQAQSSWSVTGDGQSAHNPIGEGWVLAGDLSVDPEVEVLVVEDFILRGQSKDRMIILRGTSVRCEASTCIVHAPRLHRSGHVIYAIKAEVDLLDGRVILEGIGPRSIQEET